MEKILTKQTLPATFDGACRSFQRQGIKLLCRCGEVRAIAAVTGVNEKRYSVEYEIVLTCSHSRKLEIYIHRTARQLRHLDGIEETVEELDADEQERQEIRAEMNEPLDPDALETAAIEHLLRDAA